MDFGLTLRVFFVVDQMAVPLMHLHSLRYLQYQAHDGIRLSPAISPKFHPLKEYSSYFTAHSKRFRPLYFHRFQQRPLNSVLYIYSVTRFYYFHWSLKNSSYVKYATQCILILW
jgi:hypothetical protein